MKCLVRSDWFNRLFKNGNLRSTMRGFGNHELERGMTPVNKELSDDEFLDELVKDLMIAIDRDRNGRVNFSEYLLMRKSVTSWM